MKSWVMVPVAASGMAVCILYLGTFYACGAQSMSCENGRRCRAFAIKAGCGEVVVGRISLPRKRYRLGT
jgi:hypothetical protein